ncbi:MAG TPA: hypothetical protein VFV96_06400 [Verrucomicrobiae bacterium]|nr:hypothetical protein [Verrucomicrobiae bacterium]
MNPVGAALLLVLLFVVWVAPRQWALLGMMAGVIYLTEGQAIHVGGFNMFPHRFLELAAFLRVVSRGEFSFRQLNRIDKALLWLYVFTTVVFLLRSSKGVAYQIGIAVDAFLCYFAFRGLINSVEGFRWFLRAFVIVLLPYTLIVLTESFTHHNPFAFMGGIEGGSHWMRNGRPRCFGSFRQPDTQGMFGATFLPLYVGMACLFNERKRALLGAGLCLLLAWAANAGGAASAAATGLACWALWRFRTRMRLVRWGIVGVIALLDVTMKAPVWYIFARLASITGGDGWHRSYLIDVSMQHLSQWWLSGIPITQTAGWFPYDLDTTGGADITNQYIAFGLTAGVGAMILFILLLVRAFQELGRALAASRVNASQPAENEYLLWGLGVMLMVHVSNWFGITYFDQMYMVWFMQLAAVSSLAQECCVASADSLSATQPAAAEVADGADAALDGQMVNPTATK